MNFVSFFLVFRGYRGNQVFRPSWVKTMCSIAKTLILTRFAALLESENEDEEDAYVKVAKNGGRRTATRWLVCIR